MKFNSKTIFIVLLCSTFVSMFPLNEEYEYEDDISQKDNLRNDVSQNDNLKNDISQNDNLRIDNLISVALQKDNLKKDVSKYYNLQYDILQNDNSRNDEECIGNRRSDIGTRKMAESCQPIVFLDVPPIQEIDENEVRKVSKVRK